MDNGQAGRDWSTAAGKAARGRVPLESHRDFEPGPGRDPVALLLEQAKSRVPELVPVRHGRMLVSPFTFFRGAALPMAADLAATPASGFRVQLCGDAHLSNFGVFGSPERRLVFDVNDFDETLPGPFEWDVKRLVASLVVAGRDNGFAAADARRVAVAAAARYRKAMREFAASPTLDGLVLAPGRGGRHRPLQAAAEEERGQGVRVDGGQGQDPGQHPGGGQADQGGRRPARDRQPTRR